MPNSPKPTPTSLWVLECFDDNEYAVVPGGEVAKSLAGSICRLVRGSRGNDCGGLCLCLVAKFSEASADFTRSDNRARGGETTRGDTWTTCESM